MTYSFLGASSDFSEVYLELSHWRKRVLEDAVVEGERRVRVELLGATKSYVWKRFLEPPSSDRLKRAFGAWSDVPELDSFLDGIRRDRRHQRREPSE